MVQDEVELDKEFVDSLDCMLIQMFIDDGLNEWYPFGTRAVFEEDFLKRAQHLNQRRIKWVESFKVAILPPIKRKVKSMKLNYTETARGFKLIKFEDGNCEPCNIQESSAYRDESLIWLGAEDVSVKVMTDKGWQHVDFNELFGDSVCSSYVGNQRSWCNRE